MGAHLLLVILHDVEQGCQATKTGFIEFVERLVNMHKQPWMRMYTLLELARILLFLPSINHIFKNLCITHSWETGGNDPKIWVRARIAHIRIYNYMLSIPVFFQNAYCAFSSLIPYMTFLYL